ncbi:MAG: uroporphyrinogen-III synthase [Microcoleaceae cyanobacterium]
MMRQVVDKRLSPCVIVIGEVVQLRQFILQRFIQGQVVQDQVVQDRTLQDELWSFTTGVPDIKPMFSSESHPDTLPLTGKTILVTRSEGQSTQFRDLLIAQGAGVVEMPALVIGPPSSWQPLDHALMQLTTATEPGFDWLILTSANGVNYFFERLITQDKDLRALAGTRIAVVGKKTAEVLKQYGLQPDFIPPDFIADSLVENFPENLKHRRVLFPRVESGGRETLVQQFTASGAIVVEVPAYESRCPEKIEPVALTALQQRQVDVICFASSKTVKNFHSLTQSLDPELLTGIIIASIGPQTSEACRQYLGRVNIEATEYTIPGLVQAIVTWNQG